MTEEYWLINSNRSRVKRFLKNIQCKDKFFEYMFIDYGRVSSNIGQRTTCYLNPRRIQERCGYRRMEKINFSGLEKNRVRLYKKRELGLLILYRWSINTQLLTNSGTSRKRYILFK